MLKTQAAPAASREKQRRLAGLVLNVNNRCVLFQHGPGLRGVPCGDHAEDRLHSTLVEKKPPDLGMVARRNQRRAISTTAVCVGAELEQRCTYWQVAHGRGECKWCEPAGVGIRAGLQPSANVMDARVPVFVMFLFAEDRDNGPQVPFGEIRIVHDSILA